LSETVSHALYFTKDKNAFETAYFIDKIDKFFDTLNVSSFSAGKHNRKPFQDSIRGPSDFRMKVIIYSKIMWGRLPMPVKVIIYTFHNLPLLKTSTLRSDFAFPAKFSTR